MRTREWYPIETAPKDRRILLACKRGTVVGEWFDDRYAKTPKPYWQNDQGRLFGVRAVREDQPTHWMPLPNLPTVARDPDATEGKVGK